LLDATGNGLILTGQVGHDPSVIADRPHARRPAVPPRPGWLGRVEAAADDVARGPRTRALIDLVQGLYAVAGSGDEATGWTALAVLCERPAVAPTLDAFLRRAWHTHERHADGPVGLALRSTHHDGRVREAAVAAILAGMRPELTPFLVLRTGDWVTQVRNPARAGLAVLLADDPAAYLPAMLPTAVRMQERLRGGFALAQVTAALLTAPPAVRGRVVAGAVGRHRRFVFDLAVREGWLSASQLLSAAERDPDGWVRARAAETACRDAVWHRRPAILRRLAAARRPPARANAVTGLVRAGRAVDAVAFLDDRMPPVRAIARDAARRVGVDPLAHYREAVAAAASAEPAGGGPPADGAAAAGYDRPTLVALPAGGAETAPAAVDAELTAVAGLAPLAGGWVAVGGGSGVEATLGAVEGLAEIGSPADARLLEPLLAHPDGRVRAAAVGARRRLGEVDVARAAVLLRDPHPAVVREAAGALLPFLDRLPAELPGRLLADPRSAVRLAGLRLLTAGPVAGRLRAGLLLAADPDAALARRAVADLTGLVRHSPGPAAISDVQRVDLRALARRAAPALGARTAADLDAWLTPPG
jgi:hypothetical protein